VSKNIRSNIVYRSGSEANGGTRRHNTWAGGSY